MGNPRVTLTVSCYNHERFIAEAVAGALAQTYRPLTILISDDCSTDRSFDIIRAEVQRYSGPHDVRVNRNDRNLGLIDHLYHRLGLIDTDIVIGSAGDDVSEPTRVEELMAAWSRDPAADAVCSGATYIDESGKVLGVQRTPAAVHYQGLRERLLGRLILRTNFLYGANAGWKRSLYLDYPRITPGVAEDMVIGFRALFGGGIVFVDKPLIRYRKHDTNLWSVGAAATGKDAVGLRARRARMTLLSARQHEIDLDHAAASGILDAGVADSMRPLFRGHRLLAEVASETNPENAHYLGHLLAREWIAARQMSRPRLTPWRFTEAKLLRFARGLLKRFTRRDIDAESCAGDSRAG